MAGLLLTTAVGYANYKKPLLIETAEANFWQGQPSKLMVMSLGADDPDKLLLLPDTDDFLITAGTPVKITKGGETGIGYPVQLTPLKSGALTLPPFLIQGADHAPSERQVLHVKAPALSDGMSIRVNRSADDIYLGQSVRLEFEWITSLHPRALKAVNILIPELEHNAIRAIEPAVDVQALQNKPIGLPVGSRRITGRWEKLEEKRVRIFFDYVLYPRDAGIYEFPQPVLLASVDNKTLSYRRGEFKGMRYPPHFDNNFFDGVGNPGSRTVERVMAIGETFSINVRPLPDGAPENFSGVVGRPEVNVLTDQSLVSQGDAVKVEFRVKHPDLEVFEIPSLNNVLAFNRVFDIPVAPDPVIYDKGEKVIRQTVFPDNPDISEIPPLVINYFDPDSGQYRDYVTNPVPLEVTPVKQFNFSDSELPDDVQLINQVVTSDKGIWAHLWGQSVFSEQRLGDSSIRLLVLLFLMFPPSLLLIRLIPMFGRYWKDVRGRSSLAQFRVQLQCGGEPLTLLGIYLTQRTGLSPARLNTGYIQQHLRGLRVAPTIIDELGHWLDDYHRQFSGQYKANIQSSSQSSPNQSSPNQSSQKELLRIVTQLDRQLPEPTVSDAAGVYS